MTSIYQQALGVDFEKLHPQIQQRLNFSSEDNKASIGTGVMDKVWHGRLYTLPFLYVGTWRNIMFPISGENVRFTIENYAYKDKYDRETVTWIRKFLFPKKTRRFDATMIYSRQRNMVIDYLGTHQHLVVDIHLSVAENGGLVIRSGEQRFYEGVLAFRFPMFFSGIANVCEWYDDQESKFKIEVNVINRLWGPLFGYTGTFDVEYVDIEPADIPSDVKPLREEARE